MDPESSRLLPALCAVLADPRLPEPDDTCLEKLLDWFRSLAAAGPSLRLLQEHPCLVELLRRSAEGPEPSRPVFAFSLRLAGVLSAQESCFHLLQAKLLPLLFGEQGAPGREAWMAPTVRSAWIQGLHSLAQHPGALGFLADLGAVDRLLTLQGDPSLFVVTAAGQLLVHVLGLALHNCGPPCGPPLDPQWPLLASSLLAQLEEALQPASTPQLLQALGVLTNAFTSCPAPWAPALWGRLRPAMTCLLEGQPLQAPHALGDLLLAVARSPEVTVDLGPWEMLALVLGRLEPSQGGQLALGVLQLPECPQALRAQAFGVLLQPLACVLSTSTDAPGLQELPPSAVGGSASLDLLLASRSACVGLLCCALARLALLPPLPWRPSPWPQAFLLGAVVAVLRSCNGHVPISAAGGRLCAALVGCERVQRAALDLLGALAQDAGPPELVLEVCGVLLEHVNSPDSSPTVLKKAFQASLTWLPHTDKKPHPCGLQVPAQLFLPELLQVLRKRLCSPSWEVRDSGLEFLTQAASLWAGQADFRQMLQASEVPPLARQLLRDPESYVRASAVIAVGQLSSGGLWAHPGDQQGSPLEGLLDMLDTDPDAFPRRAILQVLTAWLRDTHGPLAAHPEPLLARAFQAAGRDPDWEVRARGLELAREFLVQTLGRIGVPCPYVPTPLLDTPPADTQALHPACRTRLFEFVFPALFDYDRPVARAACELLLLLRAQTTTCATPPQAGDTPDPATVEAALHCWRTGEAGRPLGELVPQAVLAVLQALDLDDLRGTLADGSDHAEKSPLSLLQDMLAAAGAQGHNQVDCY